MSVSPDSICADIGSLENISNPEIYANKMWKEKFQIYT